MKKVLLALLLAVTMLVPLDLAARSYNAKFDKATPEAVINALKQETGMDFVYQKELLKEAKSPVTCNYTGLTLEQASQPRAVGQHAARLRSGRQDRSAQTPQHQRRLCAGRHQGHSMGCGRKRAVGRCDRHDRRHHQHHRLGCRRTLHAQECPGPQPYGISHICRHETRINQSDS